MKGKILLKEKTQKFLSFLQIVSILTLIIVIVFPIFNIIDTHNSIDSHIHDFDCAYDPSHILFTEKDYKSKNDIYLNVHEYMNGEYDKNRIYFGRSLSARCNLLGGKEYAKRNVIRYTLEGFIPIWIVSATITFVLVAFKSKRCSYKVVEQRIFGKKGFKKFDIAFSDITKIYTEKKSITIKTAEEEIKLTNIEYCDRICSLIKPYVHEDIIEESKVTELNLLKTTTQQVTSTVDDIKLF